jgi:hypothetical protein
MAGLLSEHEVMRGVAAVRAGVWLIGGMAATLMAGCPESPVPPGGTGDSNVVEDSPSVPPGDPGDPVDPPVEPPDGLPAADDLSDPGDPAVKQSYLLGLEESQGPGDHFEFDETSHWVRTSTIHGTALSVAIDRSVATDADGWFSEEFAAFVEAAFHASWHVFGGFAFDRYAVRVRAEDGNAEFSLSPVGITLSGADYGAPWGLEVVAHEMFHSWNGKFVRAEPDSSENLFQRETWLVEGGTVYYSFRHMAFALNVEEYRGGMGFRWETYQQYVGTEYDLSIPDLVALIGTAPPGDPSTQPQTNMLYARGALASYMLDQELVERGLRLDDVMRRLYLDALDGRTWRFDRLQAVLQSITGDDFGPWLDAWIDSNTPLPLDGTFDLLE